jgi:Thioredoxin-like
MRCRDNTRGEFDQYRAGMPWWSYDFDREQNAQLAALCGVSTIPCLALIDRNGDIITTKAADLLRADPSGADFPYLPKPIERLSPAVAPTINASPSCIALVDGSREGALAAAEAALKNAAEESFAQQEARSMYFFVGDCRDKFVRQLMQVSLLRVVRRERACACCSEWLSAHVQASCSDPLTRALHVTLMVCRCLTSRVQRCPPSLRQDCRSLRVHHCQPVRLMSKTIWHG